MAGNCGEGGFRSVSLFEIDGCDVRIIRLPRAQLLRFGPRSDRDDVATCFNQLRPKKRARIPIRANNQNFHRLWVVGRKAVQASSPQPTVHCLPVSQDQHRVPVTIEMIPARDGLAISGQHSRPPAEGADQHEER